MAVVAFRTVRLGIAREPGPTREPLASSADSAEAVAAGTATAADLVTAVVGATAVADRQSLETTKTPARLGFSCGGYSCPTDMLGLILPYVQVRPAISALSRVATPQGVRGHEC